VRSRFSLASARSNQIGVFITGAKTVVIEYMDASYGVHGDFKSHTGSVLTLGDATVYGKSSKQTVSTKSLTEAEVVGVSDSL
jgi:hypothetical protein